MSLPREWSLQDSRGSLHRSSGPAGVFAQFDAVPDIAESTGGSGSPLSTLGMRCSNNGLTAKNPFDSINRVNEHDAVAADIALFNEFNTAGSLFSIHSAPPVQITDMGNIAINDTTPTNANGISGGGLDSPRRPVSLALDSQQNYSTKTIAAIPIPSSEVDEDDNENLLTVSSVTARPLIAKSRELRSSKLTDYFTRKSESKPLRGHQQPQQPLDGGYGWFVVFGAFSIQFWVAGLVKSYGVLFVEILETFPSNSMAVASWIPAILSALCLALAPLSSALCQRFSCRSVVFVGGLFCALGLTLSYFATSLYHLLFTFGILTGIGGGLSTTPGIIIVSLYFNKHRALANGICVSGTAAGSFVFPMLIEYLVHHFGFHGTILILGGCMLHVCASAALYRPLEVNEADSVKPGSNNTSNGGGLNRGGRYLTNSQCIGTNDDQKRYIGQLFTKDGKNQASDFFILNGFAFNEKNSKIDYNNSDEEDKDTIGETHFSKPIKSIRSSSILHSVEDLSTDSTCVYKARTGFDSNRSSRRRAVQANKNPPVFSTEELLSKEAQENRLLVDTKVQPMSRGLSKSMTIPTPVSDFSKYWDNSIAKKNKSCVDRISRYIDVTLLKDPAFVLLCLSVTLMSTGCPYMLYFLPVYAISAGFTKSEAGFLVALSAGLDLIGRLALGYLSDLQIFNRKKAFIICILGAGFAVILIPIARSWYLIASLSALYGLCLGCWYLLMPVLLADLFGTERISSSYGFVRMFQSVGAISVPPLAGYLKDLTGGYEICFYYMGVCMVLGSIPMLVLAIAIPDEETNTEESESSTASN